jgi:hypothetical protein
MPLSSLLGPLVGVATKVGEKLYDRLQARHGVRAEVVPGFIPGRGEGLLLVKVYNSTPTPQRVMGIALELSEKAGTLILPQFPPPFQSPPQLVTHTDPYVVGFPFDDLKQEVMTRRRELGRPKIRVTGARIDLGSGRAVRANAKKVRILDF